MLYPYPTLWMNGRDVLIEDIRSESARPADEFETHVFAFVRDWLVGRQHFEINTSGSTGTPKKIVITRQQMTDSAALTRQALGLKEGQAAFICLDARYIAGMMMLVRCLTSNLRIMCATPAANPFQNLSLPYPIDFMALVPYQVQAIMQSSEDRLFYLPSKILIGGAPLDSDTQQQLQRYACSFWVTYGMTETISHIALQPLNGSGASSAFHVLPGVTIEKDNRGCLVIETTYLPEKITTNDLVDITTAERFVWLGRWDNVINTGGVKVMPESVEQRIEYVLRQYEPDVNYFIGGLPDILLGQKVVLFLETSGRSDDYKANLLKNLASSLSKFEVPKAIVCVPKFVSTNNGKLSRHKTIEIVLKS